MVEAAQERRKFDGVSPEDVVFGETLGEGKSYLSRSPRFVNSDLSLSSRCLWSRQSRLAPL